MFIVRGIDKNTLASVICKKMMQINASIQRNVNSATVSFDVAFRGAFQSALVSGPLSIKAISHCVTLLVPVLFTLLMSESNHGRYNTRYFEG